MKKTIFILSIIAFIAGGCGQKPNKSVTEANNVDSLKISKGEPIDTLKNGNDHVSQENYDSTSNKKEVSYFDWKGVKCKEHQEADGYTNVEECIFPNANLQQVYNIVKRIDPNLKPELPVTNIKYPSTKNGCITVNYQYKSKKHLLINLLYNGGETDIEIIENEDNTQSKIAYSAD